MEKEVIKTDRRYRKNLFNTYLIGIAACIAFWRWGRPLLIDYVRNLPIKAQVETIELLSHLFLLLFIPPAIYLMVVGHRVCSHKAIPYPGMKVIHDTVVLRGKKALFRGRSMLVLGVTLIIMVFSSIVSTHLIITKFKHHPLFRSVFYGTQQRDQ